MSRMDTRRSLWLGAALLPQAGVAMGIALIASQTFPEHGDTILQVAVAGTVVFELVGPILTRFALQRVGEAYPLLKADTKPE